MNRREEYWALISELKEEPAALESSVQRAIKRAKRRRWKRSLSSLAGVCAAFVLMVNASPAFAVSCGNIPILKEIASAVAWSPSLKSAIEHDFIQYIGQLQTLDRITLTLESVIADAQQMVVFYRADYPGAEDDLWHSISCDLKDSDGVPLKQYSVTSGSSQEGLSCFEIHFADSAPPQDLILDLQLHFYNGQDERKSTSTYTFPLHLNPAKIAQNIQLPVNQWVELDGQRLLVERLELSPTTTALYLDDDRSNTAWLKSLDFYFTDRNGTRYDQPDNSISAMGRGTEGFYTYYHQSLYFLDDLDGLKLHITGATWQDKNEHTIQVDLTCGQADWLPEYILELSAKEENYANDGLQKTLEISTSSSRMCIDYTYYDPEGGEHRFNGGGMSQAYTDDEGVYHPYRFYYMLKDYPFDQVTVELDYTHVTELATPVEIPIP